MVSEPLVAGLLAGYGIAVPVGAIAPLLVSLTARTSWRVGAAAALGVATADGMYALAAVLGGAAVTRVIQPVATPMRWVAAVVLTVWATRTAVIALRHHQNQTVTRSTTGLTTPWRAYGGLLGLTLLNPTTIVYFGALVLGGQAAGQLSSPAGTVFVAAVFTASATWQLLLAGGGALLGRLLTSARGRLTTALASSLLIVLLAVNILIAT